MSKTLTKQLYQRMQDKLGAAATATAKAKGKSKGKDTEKKTGGGFAKRKQKKANRKLAAAKAAKQSASPQGNLAKNVRLLRKLGNHKAQEEVLAQVLSRR